MHEGHCSLQMLLGTAVSVSEMGQKSCLLCRATLCGGNVPLMATSWAVCQVKRLPMYLAVAIPSSSFNVAIPSSSFNVASWPSKTGCELQTPASLLEHVVAYGSLLLNVLHPGCS